MAKTATSRPTLVENVTTILSERHREIALLGSLLSCTFSMVSLVGYAPTDPTLLTPGDGEVTNPCGPLGALLADILFQSLGYGAWVVFGAMVLSVLALAGRSIWRWSTAFLTGSLYTVTLAGTHLVLRPGDSFPPGGWVGAVVAESMEGVIGGVGAWLVIVGGALGSSTLLFQIRWTRLFGRLVDRAEAWVPVLRRVAGNGASSVGGVAGAISSAMAARAQASARRMGATGLQTARRMGRSLTRREGELPSVVEDDDEGLPSSVDGRTGLEVVATGDEPDALVPASEIERTAVGGGVELAEVQWVPTEEVDAASELLQMFPELTPRPSTALSQVSLPADPFRDAPTRPSDGPVPTTPSDDWGPTPPSAPARVAAPVPTPAPAPRVAAPALLDDDGSDVDDLPPPVVAKARPAPVDGPGAKVGVARFVQDRVDDDGESLRAQQRDEPFVLPKLKLLDIVPTQQAEFDSEELRELASRVEEVLESFKVKGEVTEVSVGPVVTTFEFVPAKGISVRKVNNLADDLAMGLCALSVRIVAPIPGKGCVGIEIPSSKRLNIYLRELMASDAFRKAKMSLPMVLGKDVEGGPVVADLAKMPHLLVGGTTGAGKSVGVNGMLMSLLFTKSPEELRLLLVDPKKLEFKMYEDIPHLLHPVVTEPNKAAAALAWACREMDERYELLAHWDTRNINSYNDKVARELENWTDAKARRYAPKDWPSGKAFHPRKLPYIVIVIDELADLMLVAKKEVEGSIARLTQMARACGIHLIVATQRPSVDVVTGLIKSNLPTRISFKLRSGTDSRTILDAVGAEALLGRGDMLYLPNAGDIIRAHGAFVSDDEVGRVVEFLRAQGEPDYIDAVTAEPSESEDIADEELDELFDEAMQICVSAGKASTSMIQRHLKIGYNRAARIVDQLEARGIIGPADGARPREVLI